MNGTGEARGNRASPVFVRPGTKHLSVFAVRVSGFFLLDEAGDAGEENRPANRLTLSIIDAPLCRDVLVV